MSKICRSWAHLCQAPLGPNSRPGGDERNKTDTSHGSRRNSWYCTQRVAPLRLSGAELDLSAKVTSSKEEDSWTDDAGYFTSLQKSPVFPASRPSATAAAADQGSEIAGVLGKIALCALISPRLRKSRREPRSHGPAGLPSKPIPTEAEISTMSTASSSAQNSKRIIS